MRRFEHFRRLIGTVVGFAVFGVAGLIVGLVIFPLMFVFKRDTRTRQIAARKLIGKGFGAFIWLTKVLGVLSYKIEGMENIKSDGNQLIIANHPTLLDVVFLVSLFSQADCVIKTAVTKNLFMRSTVAAANYISNADPDELLMSCVTSLKSGNSLLLFPEGTRTAQGQPLDFKLGAATVAARTNVDILPIAIVCSPISLTKKLPWHYIPPERPNYTFKIMPPTPVTNIVLGDEDERHTRHKLNDSMLDLLFHEISAIERFQGAHVVPPTVIP